MAGIDNNTVLMLHCENFIDSSLSPKAITNSNASIADNGKFGKCISFNGSTSMLKCDNEIDLSNDFTIDFYVNLLNLTNSQCFYYDGRKVGCPIITLQNGNLVIYEIVTVGSNSVKTISITPNLKSNTLHHMSIVRKNKEYYLSIDGVVSKIGTATNTVTFSVLQQCCIGAVANNNWYLNGIIDEFRISNVSRWTTNFTPPTQSYNSININVISQTETNVAFNVAKLGTETINKVEVLINNKVSQTYTSGYDNINYTIDNSLCNIGNNNIKIKVTYDTNYTEEKILTHTYTVNPLPITVGLKAKNDRDTILYNSLVANVNNLKTTLDSKGVDVTGVNEMSILVDKVNLLPKYDNPILYLYKDGDECANVTGGILGSVFDTRWSAGGSIAKNSDNIYIESNATSSTYCAYTKNKIDVSNYSKLYAEVMTTYVVYPDTDCVKLFVCDSIPSTGGASLGIAHINSYNKKTVLVLDISNINKSVYLGALCISNTDGYLYKMWLEK